MIVFFSATVNRSGSVCAATSRLEKILDLSQAQSTADEKDDGGDQDDVLDAPADLLPLARTELGPAGALPRQVLALGRHD